VLTLDPVRVQAFEANAAHYADVFSKGRDAYAIPAGALTDPARLRAMSAFFFWTSWVASTNRPGSEVTYTQNWPHEPLVANAPTSGSVIWSALSVVFLIAGIGAFVTYRARQAEDEDEPPTLPEADPFLSAPATPSQKATYKYFAVVAALVLAQIGLGILTAHYGVEGSGSAERTRPLHLAR